jgi:ATP-dependent protease ClpP protease subunit
MNKDNKNKPVLFFTDKLSATKYDVYLTGEIEAAADYIPLFDILRNAGSEDVIRIFINSPGGNFWTAMQFIAAINKSNAHIEGHIEGECHSAASMIFLACNSFNVPEFATMLCHFYTSGYRGKGHEISQWVDHQQPHYKNIINDIYKYFFSEDELKRMGAGTDFWLTGDEIVVRLDNKVKCEKKEIQAIEKKTKKKKK